MRPEPSAAAPLALGAECSAGETVGGLRGSPWVSLSGSSPERQVGPGVLLLPTVALHPDGQSCLCQLQTPSAPLPARHVVSNHRPLPP